MKKEQSKWTKSVRKAMIDKNMTIKQLAERIGYGTTTVSLVINGRYSNASCKTITEKINDVLGTRGLPERVNTPSNSWCTAVKAELINRCHNGIHPSNIKELAQEIGISRDKLSLIVNGRLMNEQIVDDINTLLGIKLPAVPCDS